MSHDRITDVFIIVVCIWLIGTTAAWRYEHHRRRNAERTLRRSLTAIVRAAIADRHMLTHQPSKPAEQRSFGFHQSTYPLQAPIDQAEADKLADRIVETITRNGIDKAQPTC